MYIHLWVASSDTAPHPSLAAGWMETGLLADKIEHEQPRLRDNVGQSPHLIAVLSTY